MPAGVETMVRHGHQVLVQTGAGLGSGISDEEFEAAGATPADVGEGFERVEMIISSRSLKRRSPVSFEKVKSCSPVSIGRPARS